MRAFGKLLVCQVIEQVEDLFLEASLLQIRALHATWFAFTVFLIQTTISIYAFAYTSISSLDHKQRVLDSKSPWLTRVTSPVSTSLTFISSLARSAQLFSIAVEIQDGKRTFADWIELLIVKLPLVSLF